jgi:hypothetical protein
MSGFESFDRQLAFATEGIAPENIAKELAKFARVELAKAIAAGASPQYERFVNNRPGLPEEAVTIPGSILYVFSNWNLVINAAIAELQKRSPRRSGRFASSFIVIANGALTMDFASIPAAAEVIVTNAMPYVRRIEAGANNSKGKRMFDLSRVALNRRFNTGFMFETRYLNIGAGLHPQIPYILKGSQGRRKDRQAGSPLTYPSIVINAL